MVEKITGALRDDLSDENKKDESLIVFEIFLTKTYWLSHFICRIRYIVRH